MGFFLKFFSTERLILLAIELINSAVKNPGKSIKFRHLVVDLRNACENFLSHVN